jgi:hypothetical protein
MEIVVRLLVFLLLHKEKAKLSKKDQGIIAELSLQN